MVERLRDELIGFGLPNIPIIIIDIALNVPTSGKKTVESKKGNNHLYVILADGSIHDGGRQILAQGFETNYKEKMNALAEIMDRRIIKADGFDVVVLCCGEINALHYEQNNKRVLHRRLSPIKLRKYLDRENTLFVNPTHDMMGFYHKLNPKRRYLSSKKGQGYISASNWNLDKSKPQSPGLKTHTYWIRNTEASPGKALLADRIWSRMLTEGNRRYYFSLMTYP